MTTVFQKASIALALGATALAVASPAEAQRYGGYRGRDNGGTAVVAGIAGLAIGAALASNGDRGRYYDRGYDAYGYDEPVVIAEPYYYGGPIYRGGYDGYYQQRGYYPSRGYYRDGRGGYDHGRGRGYDHGGRGDHRR